MCKNSAEVVLAQKEWMENLEKKMLDNGEYNSLCIVKNPKVIRATCLG